MNDDQKYCELCEGEMDGSEHFDDICDECAITEGLLDEEE